MNIFIDTSVKGCNIALFDDQSVLAMAQEPIERGHAETLLPLFENLAQSIGKTPNDIENIYTTIGPGSFTGLRVGLTTAQFMGFSLQKPVHGITTFQAFSAGCDGDQKRAVLIETKRSDYYVQIMDSNHNPVGEAQSVDAAEIENIIDGDMIVTGDAIERLVSEINIKNKIVHQSMINIEKMVAAINSGCVDYRAPEPLYVRDVDVSQPKKKA